MPDFDYIDIINYVTYGNDFDEEWNDIREIIKSDPEAKRMYEEAQKDNELKMPRRKNLPSRQTSEESVGEGADETEKRKWWQI